MKRISIGCGKFDMSERRQIIDGRSLMRALAVVCQCGGDGNERHEVVWQEVSVMVQMGIEVGIGGSQRINMVAWPRNGHGSRD
jgi:hypothetical protein